MRRRVFPMAVCVALPVHVTPIADRAAAASGRTMSVVVSIGMVA